MSITWKLGLRGTFPKKTSAVIDYVKIARVTDME